MGGIAHRGVARPLDAQSSSVIIRAAQVVPALRADQLAVVAGEAVRAGRADLTMMVDRQLGDGVAGSPAL